MSMNASVLTLIVIFGSLLAMVTVVCWMIVTVTSRKRSGLMSDEESRIMQELHQALVSMDERVEALETILLERDHRPRQ